MSKISRILASNQMPALAKEDGPLEAGRAQYVAELADLVRRSAPPRGSAREHGATTGAEQRSGPRRVAAVEAALANLFVRSVG